MGHNVNEYMMNRMNNPQVVKGFIHTIKTAEPEIAKICYGNLALQVSEHPRFIAIQQAYEERFNK